MGNIFGEDMIKKMEGFTFSDKVVDVATKRAKKQRVSPKSIRKGKGTPAGNIGEVMVKKIFGGHIVNDFQYDILTNDGAKIEVKTKEISSKDGLDITPTLEWDASVSKENDSQDCDHYAFCRVNIHQKKGWYMGIISRNEFFDKARELKKGDKDGDNGYVVKQSCWNLKYREIYDDYKSYSISE